MNNNIHWRLQICSHKEIFTDRDTAMKYIRREFLPDSMVGEPTLYFYGDSDEPNAILAFGVGDRRIATIDVGAVSDRVDEIETSETENFEKLDNAIATLKDVINAAGLTFDENKIQNQVTYEPDVKDELIGDTTSLGEAIAVISKFAQNSFKSTNLIPVESKSIAVSYTATDKGMELKPSVKFSTYGDTDTLDDNNNILGLKPDGIYATVNLEYDPEKCELSFVTSGMKDGKFMDDANRKVIKLGEHTQYTPDNNGYNVNLVVDKDKNTISANVKISEDPNNILSVQDEKLFVNGRATNIKYKSGTVYSGINQLETSFNDFKDEVNSELDTVKKHISDVEENTTIEGDTTDTMVITATKETNVGYRISGGVRLGSNKTIIHKDGGLEVDIEITCDIVSNKLIVRTGNVTKEVKLPGVDFIDNAYYDSVTQDLVIEFNNGNTVRIPMSGLDNAVAVETENRVAEDKKLSDAIQAEQQRAEDAEIALHERINVLTSSVASQVSSAIAESKTYTDTQLGIAKLELQAEISNAKTEAVNTASSDATSKADKALVDAKAYTDSEIAKLNLPTSIEELKAKDKELETSLATKIESVEVVKDETNDLHYQVLVDGIVAGNINIPQDQFLKSVSYDNASHKLQFIFKTENEHEQPIEVNISDLVDTYAAGDGMSLSANTFSVRKATLSEKYLTVSADGVSINGIDAAIDTLNRTIDTKANSVDVYTKEEIDKKGYLTTVDLSGYATKTDVADETSRAQIAEKLNAVAIDTLENRATAIETNVSLLQAEDRRLNIITSETNSIALTASKADGGTTLKADLKLNTTEDNIIKLDGNGVYSSVALNYNKAENSIALIVNGNEKSKFTLSEHSLVQEGHYDSVTQNIVLTIAKDGGETQQISIPVGDIVNEWTIDNGTDNPITLTKTAGADNVDVLRARLTISTEAHNGILNNNGTLYMSNEASKLTALWGGDEVTVQKAIENLKIENDKVAVLVSDVDTLKSDMAQAKNDITVLQQGNVANLQTKVEQNTRNIAQNTSAINNLTTQVTELGSQVTNLSNQFTELSNQVGGYEDRISKLEGDLTTVNNNINTINQAINQIKEQIGEPVEGKPSVAERLTTIEEAINKLIDFGAYESNF